ncbi:MAG: ankyrin repeat domain-containing protein, partial [Fimbriimonadaceae bacterium]
CYAAGDGMNVGNGLVGFYQRVQLQNHTHREIHQVELTLRITLGSKLLYTARKVVSKFENVGFPIAGPLLCSASTPYMMVRFDVPRQFYVVGAMQQVFVGKVNIWNGKGDLHNPVHLFSTFAANHNPEMMQIFAKDKSLINVQNDQGFSAILMAFAVADREMTSWLKKQGADPLKRTKLGQSAMYFAALSGDAGQMEYAKTLGLSVNESLPKSKITPMLVATSEGEGRPQFSGS